MARLLALITRLQQHKATQHRVASGKDTSGQSLALPQSNKPTQSCVGSTGAESSPNAPVPHYQEIADLLADDERTRMIRHDDVVRRAAQFDQDT